MTDTTKNLFFRQSFNIQTTLKSSELQNHKGRVTDSTDIESKLIDKIKNSIGNKCNKLGYIDKDSIKLISRSIGKINTSHFNGDINYDVILEASICKPSDGDKIRCKVIGKNKIGIFAVANPIHIILASAHHTDTSVFEHINENDIIEIEIINYKLNLNSNIIKVIGKYIKKIK